jgi:hypothetical protein
MLLDNAAQLTHLVRSTRTPFLSRRKKDRQDTPCYFDKTSARRGGSLILAAKGQVGGSYPGLHEASFLNIQRTDHHGSPRSASRTLGLRAPQ